MPGDPYYQTKEWKELRVRALKRDHWRCTVPGCDRNATHVDHIVPRRHGGLSDLINLRSLCVQHDAGYKERSDGTRRGGLGHGADGLPLDPNHPWNRAQSRSRGQG